VETRIYTINYICPIEVLVIITWWLYQTFTSSDVSNQCEAFNNTFLRLAHFTKADFTNQHWNENLR